MARLIASLHDASGRVAVAGFYDDVRELSRAERAAIAALPFDERTYLAQIGAPAAFGEPGYSTLERQWTRPTLEINGMWGGYAGAGSEDGDPARGARQDHVSPRARPGSGASRRARVTASRIARAAGHAAVDRPDGPRRGRVAHRARPFRAPGCRPGAPRSLWSRPLRVRMGGTVPIGELFQRHMGLSTVFFSFSTADEDYHAPNEFFRVHRLHEGLEAWARYWTSSARSAHDCGHEIVERVGDHRARASRSRRRSAQRVAQEGTRRPRSRAHADPVHRRTHLDRRRRQARTVARRASGCSRSCCSICRRPAS